jgi:hypothetical protein
VRPISISKSLTAPSANNIALSQTPAAGASVTLNGSTVTALPLGPFGATVNAAVLDTQRRILITSAGNDTGTVAYIVGLNEGGGQISENLPLGNISSVVSALDYKVILSIKFSAGAAGAITVGTTTIGSTNWYVPNYNLTPFNMQFITEANGSVTWNLETTNDLNYFNPPRGLGGTTPIANVATLVPAGTVAQVVPLTEPVTGWRFTITAGTGLLTAQGQQAGIANY